MIDPVKILSDVTVHNKYARYIPGLQRRETWCEVVTRNMDMHIKKFPYLEGEIRVVYSRVYTKRQLPSMRSLQFGGTPIELANNRIYNCGYLPMDDEAAFSELMFLLLGGSGIGYSVQHHDVCKLPLVSSPAERSRRFKIGDSIEGWADAVKVLVESYFYGKASVKFDYRDIRLEGSLLKTTGGRAPGPEPLRRGLERIEAVLKNAVGRKLRPIEVHDICCHIADTVLAGGIRRAAMICLFDRNDEEMLSCKSGEWWVDNPQRGRANNSAVLPRGEVTKEEFFDLMQKVEASGAGEPGVYWTSNVSWGSNPCCEVALQPFQFCNLVEINASDLTSQEDFNQRCKDAAFIATLQASYTDFHYLRPEWREQTEEEALIGVGMTGIASGVVTKLDMTEGAKVVVEENKRVAKLIGINPAARCTVVKPSGTSSLVLGTSSGIHAWHNDYYIRRTRISKNDPLYTYMKERVPGLVQDLIGDDTQAVLEFPQKAPRGASLRTESTELFLTRVRKVTEEWIIPGHNSGDNTNNVSCTVSVRPNEWDQVSHWMWENRDRYNGISVIPYDGGTYTQTPFEDITKEKYEEMVGLLADINLKMVTEYVDNTSLGGEAACAGGACEI